MKKQKVVAILGASDKKERYSYKALCLLQTLGYKPVPVHPKLVEIGGVKTFASLADLKNDSQKIDTLTVYVKPEISSKLVDEIVALRLGRVILNPGTENPFLEESLQNANIPFEKACTLVLLNTGQF